MLKSQSHSDTQVLPQKNFLFTQGQLTFSRYRYIKCRDQKAIKLVIVTISFALPATNREIERKENSSDFGVRTTRGGN